MFQMFIPICLQYSGFNVIYPTISKTINVTTVNVECETVIAKSVDDSIPPRLHP